jgi:2-polyprenyl-6-methoxyphenol hydroxylase-like FAD-dependent oxidoreductase
VYTIDFNYRIPSELSKIAPPSAPPLESVKVAYELGEEFPEEAGFYGMTSLEPMFRLGLTPETTFLRAHRARLRQWLATDIAVAWRKRYVRHAIEADGTVTAYFEDGSTAHGDLLVGADGAMSPVRGSLGFEDPEVVAVASVGGELRLDAKKSAEFQALGHSFFRVGAPDCFLFVGIRDIAPGAMFADHYWLFMWTDATMQHKSREHWTKTASKEERLEFAKRRLAELNAHPKFREIIDTQPVDGMLDSISFHVRLPERSPDGPVTLLGDSMHAMPPFRGQGANNAISDSLLLGSYIVEGVRNQNQSPFRASDIVRAYETEMIPRATGWVLASSQSTENFLIASARDVITPLAPNIQNH